jgi:hypothetical protein
VEIQNGMQPMSRGSTFVFLQQGCAKPLICCLFQCQLFTQSHGARVLKT